MIAKYFLSILLLIISFILVEMPFVAMSFTKDKQPSSLKLVIKTDAKLVGSIKETVKKLNILTVDMEKTAKLYKTTDYKVYWESEAKRSFFKLLQSQGYYNARIETEFPELQNTIIFHINGWERYKIKKIQFTYAENSNKNIIIPDLVILKIKEGDFAIASAIISAQIRLAEEIENNNCLLTLEVDNAATVDDADNTISVDFIINAGVQAKIQSVEIKGLTSLNPEYARKLIPIKNGQCFKQSLILDTKKSLQRTGLFAITNPEIPEHTNQNGEVPIIFDLKERKHRSLKAGVNYGSDLGLGGTIGWDHRNFFGNGENVKSDLFVNQRNQKLDITFTKPFYKRDDQTLKMGVSAGNTVSKAFNSKEGALSIGLDRKLAEIWTAGASSKYSYASITRNKRTKHFSFISFPLFIKRDTKDDVLNTLSGNELILKTEPFYPIKRKDESFLKSEIIGSSYIPLASESKFKPVIALKASAGSITEAKLAKIPENERFYLGGPGSLRGYADQLAGPLDDTRRPIGGVSFITTTIEFRTKITENIGLVTFFDSGNVFDSVTPKLKEKMFHGFGFGARYFTDFGPFRVDIAFPMKRRQKIDRPFQIYFGIGQTF